MKVIKVIIGIILFQTLSLFGDVKFEFKYADKPGTGFHIRPKAKAALEEVGRLIGSNWLKQHKAKIIVQVLSEEDAEEHYLAVVEAVEHINDINIYRFAPARKIILGQKNPNAEFDAIVKVNFHYSYGFGDKVSSKQYDFKEMLIHEITHVLGLHSSSFECPESFLEYSLDDFIKQLFAFGINAIEGKVDDHKLRKLVKKLILLNSAKVDIDAYILNKAISPLEVLQMRLILEFKRTLEGKAPLTDRAKLLNQFSSNLAQKGMTIQEYIKFHNKSESLKTDMLLEFQALLENNPNSHEEKKLRKVLITHERLHGCFKDYITQKFNNFINDLAEEDKEHGQDQLKCIQEVILFYARYLIIGSIDVEELERIKALISIHDINIEQYARKIVEEEKARKVFEINKKSEGYTYFDSFVTKKDGKKLFEGKVANKIIKSCLLKDGEQGTQLHFSGPNTLKYIGSAIPLNGMDGSHISSNIKSIMNPISPFGLQSREWDAHTTAIMLDLGYNVENHWTRLWSHGKAEENKRSQDKEKKRKAKTKKGANKTHRAKKDKSRQEHR